MLTVPAPALEIPAPTPNSPTVLPDSVLWLTTSDPPKLRMAPPSNSAWLFDRTQSVTVRLPSLCIPPPVPPLPTREDWPFAIVHPDRVTVLPLETKKGRYRDCPLIVIISAPGPVISTSSVSSGRSEDRTIVPFNPALNSIVSGPGLALADIIAALSVPAPLSFKLSTEKVAA